MKDTAPTQDQALCFYRAALSTARLIDRENEHRVLDTDADAAWRAYGGDLQQVLNLLAVDFGWRLVIWLLPT
ncbi:hypothetical protein [Sorangium sp. So ce887]|uniref:hypothetical protein n=1 Tax=Sorangium sp. So ce887 TaxID=3133324 RepID=UPI003F62DE97